MGKSQPKERIVRQQLAFMEKSRLHTVHVNRPLLSQPENVCEIASPEKVTIDTCSSMNVALITWVPSSYVLGDRVSEAQDLRLRGSRAYFTASKFESGLQV